MGFVQDSWKSTANTSHEAVFLFCFLGYQILKVAKQTPVFSHFGLNKQGLYSKVCCYQNDNFHPLGMLANATMK